MTPTVRAVLAERLAALAADARVTLCVGALVGARFEVTLVAAVLDAPVASVLAALSRPVEAGIVAEAAPGEYAFAHPLFRSVLADDVGVAERVDLHGRIANQLELRMQDRTLAELSALAFHFLAAAPAGGAAKAVVYAEAAARAAMAVLAYQEAASLFEQALAADR